MFPKMRRSSLYRYVYLFVIKTPRNRCVTVQIAMERFSCSEVNTAYLVIKCNGSVQVVNGFDAYVAYEHRNVEPPVTHSRQS
jgi:hypothetical protein